jgi:uncharacterized membrane protein YfcA
MNSILVIALVFLIAGTVKGISGMGLPTISMAILSLLMLPAKAAMLMVMPSLLTNVTQCMGKHWRSLIKNHWAMWAALVLTTIFSPYSGLDVAGGHATLFLGLVLMAYGVWGLFKPTLPSLGNNKSFIGGIVGILSGLVTVATGVFVIPLVPYLQSLKLSKDEFIQALGISFTVATIALTIRLGATNTKDWSANLPEIAMAIIAAFIGMWIGARLRDKINPIQFQRLLYTAFTVLGMLMTYKSI